MKHWALAYIIGLVLAVIIVMYGVYEYKIASKSRLALIIVISGAVSVLLCVTALYGNFKSLPRIVYDDK